MGLRLLAAAVLSFVLTVGVVAGAGAGMEWCEADPVVIITTPGGSTVPVYVTNGAEGVEHAPALVLARMSYSAAPVSDGHGTLVRLDVVVPGDQFATDYATRSKISSGPLGSGTLYATTTGWSNKVMQMSFVLPQS
jgi:hypothetical protein